MGIYTNFETATYETPIKGQVKLVKNIDGSFSATGLSGALVRIKADSAIDSSDLVTLSQVQSIVASGGSSTLAFGTAAYANVSDFATIFQGLKADSALQIGSNISVLSNDAGYLTKTQADQLYSTTSNNAIGLNNSKILDIEITSSTTIPNQLVYSFNAYEYRTLKLIIQATCGTSFHSSEYFAMHDGTDVHSTEYAMLANIEPLYNIDMSISNNVCSIFFTPTNPNTIVRANLTLINA